MTTPKQGETRETGVERRWFEQGFAAAVGGLDLETAWQATTAMSAPSASMPESETPVQAGDVTIVRREVFHDFTSGVTGPTAEDYQVAQILNRRIKDRTRDNGTSKEAEIVRARLLGVVKGYAAGENAESKHWREHAEKAESLLQQRDAELAQVKEVEFPKRVEKVTQDYRAKVERLEAGLSTLRTQHEQLKSDYMATVSQCSELQKLHSEQANTIWKYQDELSKLKADNKALEEMLLKDKQEDAICELTRNLEDARQHIQKLKADSAERERQIFRAGCQWTISWDRELTDDMVDRGIAAYRRQQQEGVERG